MIITINTTLACLSLSSRKISRKNKQLTLNTCELLHKQRFTWAKEGKGESSSRLPTQNEGLPWLAVGDRGVSRKSERKPETWLYKSSSKREEMNPESGLDNYQPHHKKQTLIQFQFCHVLTKLRTWPIIHTSDLGKEKFSSHSNTGKHGRIHSHTKKNPFHISGLSRPR